MLIIVQQDSPNNQVHVIIIINNLLTSNALFELNDQKCSTLRKNNYRV